MAESSSRWNIFAGFMAGLVLGVFAAAWTMQAYLTATAISPRQNKIDELEVKVIELEHDRDRWLNRAYETSARPR